MEQNQCPDRQCHEEFQTLKHKVCGVGGCVDSINILEKNQKNLFENVLPEFTPKTWFWEVLKIFVPIFVIVSIACIGGVTGILISQANAPFRYASKEIVTDNTGKIIRLEIQVKEIQTEGEEAKKVQIINQKELIDKIQEAIDK